MRKVLSVFKGLCPIGAAVIVYLCLSEIFSAGENILYWVLAAVFSSAVTVICWILAAVYDKVANIESSLGIYIDRGYEQEDIVKKECPVCHRDIDADYVVCPYCESRQETADGGNPYGDKFSHAEKDIVFNTEDPDYNGTDFSEEAVISGWVGGAEDGGTDSADNERN